MTGLAADTALPVKEGGSPYAALAALVLLAKPGIVAAVTFSGFTGMVLAGRALPEPGHALATLVSLFLMAAGSALVNSVLDRDADRRMPRLAPRTRALKRVGIRPPLVAAALLTASALALASWQLGPAVPVLLCAASLSYAVCYTLFLKPYTHWAAVLGGLPGALPALVGSAAVGAPFDRAALALFLVLLVWQPAHFWLLALSHAEEYRAAGIPVLVLVKGEQATRVSVILGSLLLIPVTLLPWLAGPCSAGYAKCALLLGISFLLACCGSLGSPRHCRRMFRGSILYLLLLHLAMVADLA